MNVRNSLKDFPLFVAVKAALMADKVRLYYKRAIVGAMTWFLAPLAHADDDIAGMITAALNGVYSLKDPIVKASMVLGLACILIAIGLLAGKKNNPQIKIWHVLVLLVAGACFIGIDQIASRSQKQMNLNPVSVG